MRVKRTRPVRAPARQWSEAVPACISANTSGAMDTDSLTAFFAFFGDDGQVGAREPGHTHLAPLRQA